MNGVNPQLASLVRPLVLLRPDPKNAREHGEESYAQITASYREFGQQKPVVGVEEPDGTVTVIDGNGQLEACKRLGWDGMAVVLFPREQRDKAVAYAVAINRSGEFSQWNPQALAAALGEIQATFGADMLLATGFSEQAYAQLTDSLTLADTPKDAGAGESSGGGGRGTFGPMADEDKRRLKDRFLFPPFSVLDTRSGPWQERRAAWLKLGIRSEVGRAEGLAFNAGEFKTDTSVFDPVVCELVYRWFLPVRPNHGGPVTVLDPTCGGSVRGVVAAVLGAKYTGNDLRPEQIDANKQQWVDIAARLGVDGKTAMESSDDPRVTDDPTAHTPVDFVESLGVWVKRDDLFSVDGVRGGKVRTCLALARRAMHRVAGLSTAGSRSSPQVNIVAHVARKLRLKAAAHTPSGPRTPEVQAAQDAGAEVYTHTPGHNSVIIARSREYAAANKYEDIPFGMECLEAVTQTASQVPSILPMIEDGRVKRLVVPVGSGMSLAGVLHGLRTAGVLGKVEILAVKVGASPDKRLDRFAPGWRSLVGASLTLVQSEMSYDTAHPAPFVGSILLDPHYEAKCLPYLQPGDLLWVVGIRKTALQATQAVSDTVHAPRWVVGDATDLSHVQGMFDLVFTCPPYGDLEVYSDRPDDMSNMDPAEFFMAWDKAIQGSVAKLRDNRFAVVVLGDWRDRKTGLYNDFVARTCASFRAAGAPLYNSAVLVNAVGTLAMRIGPQWPGRKMGTMHQHLLVFLKGDHAAVPTEFGGDGLPPEMA